MIVVNEEIFHLDVFSLFGAQNVAILSQGKCAHVVLKNDVISDSVTLCFEKIPCPEDIACLIIKTDDFTLGGTLGWYFVLGQRACCRTLAKCENGSCMSLVIIMCLMECINVPVESGERVGKKRVMCNLQVELRYLRSFFNLPQSSLSGCLTHVVRKVIVG